VGVVKKAMVEKLGDEAEEVIKVLQREGIPRNVAKEAAECAKKQGAFTIFALVDAITRMGRKIENAGERTEMDARAGRLLALAA